MPIDNREWYIEKKHPANCTCTKCQQIRNDTFVPEKLCPICGEDTLWFNRSLLIYRCQNPECRTTIEM